MGRIPKEKEKPNVNIIEAAASGASDGLKLAANVAAMLLAFVALIAMVDALFIYLSQWTYHLIDTTGNFVLSITSQSPLSPEDKINLFATWKPLSLPMLLGWLFTPIAFFLGIPAADLSVAGTLIGKKIVFNEFIAYLDLAQFSQTLNPRSSIILSYALCGFANFSSIAIQIGGIGPMVPERKKELAQFGIRSVIGGSLAAFITASIAGLLI